MKLSVLAAFVALAACGPSRVRSGSGNHADLGLSQGDLGAPDLAQAPLDLGFPDLTLPPPEPVHVVLTADNAYVFGWGDQGQVAQLYGRPGTTSAGDIFNCPIGKGPEAYDVAGEDAPGDAYL